MGIQIDPFFIILVVVLPVAQFLTAKAAQGDVQASPNRKKFHVALSRWKKFWCFFSTLFFGQIGYHHRHVPFGHSTEWFALAVTSALVGFVSIWHERKLHQLPDAASPSKGGKNEL